MAAEDRALIGRVIDRRFTIRSILGRGGMGVVCCAQQAVLDRSVALKLLTGVPSEREPEFQRRFFLEAATAAKLKHRNTITIFDYGRSDGFFFMAMELVDGYTLAQLTAKGRALAPIRAVGIAMQIGRSLREAHRAGVVHRDLKPANVMVVRPDGDDDDSDFVKVLDFGLAKVRAPDLEQTALTQVGTFMGSPRYVAPEQIEARSVDARADIYSLGCILFRMLTGNAPYDGRSPVEILLKHVHCPIPPVPGVPASLEQLVVECLAKTPAGRPPTMDAVLKRLKAARAELPADAGPLALDDAPAAVEEAPPADPSEPPTVIARMRVVSAPSAPPIPDDDSTRPTQIYARGTTAPVIRPPRRRSRAGVAAAFLIGVALCAGAALWLDADLARAATALVQHPRLWLWPVPVTLPGDPQRRAQSPL